MVTNGIKYYYAPETQVDAVPTTGWKEIPDYTSWGEIGSTPDNIEITPVTETDFKRYEQGLMDTGSVDVTGNWSKEFLDAWEGMREAAETARTSGKVLWFAQDIPNYDKSFCYSGMPSMISFPELTSNAALQPSGSITVRMVKGLVTKPTFSL